MSYGYLSLLIVDDEPSIRNGLASSINWNDIGIEVIGVAADGNEAITMIRTLRPSIVITDIRMPYCDGLELIRMVREEDIPCNFIILSGYDDFKYAQTAIRFQVNSYLLKPIQIEELLKELITLRDLTLEEMEKNNNLRVTKQQLLLQNDALIFHFCLKLLNNEYKTEAEIESQLSSFHVPLKNVASRVLVFLYRVANSQEESATISSFKKSFMSKIKQAFNDYSYMLVTQNATSITLIINNDSTFTPSLETLHFLCHKILNQLQENFLISVNVGVGEIVSSLLYTNTSYLSALEAVSYRIYQTDQKIFDSTAISHVATPVISPSPKINQELVDAIYGYNIDELNRLLHDFFHSLFYVEIPPPNYIRGMCTFLMIDVQNGLSTYIEEINPLFYDIPYIEINKLESFREIRKWITNKFTTYTEFMKNNASSAKDPMIQKAKAFINDNIYNKIKAENVASHVGLSENYFTVYFKDKTNENFKNYVQNLKMEKAKEHLKTSNIRISELSAMLGYEDYRSFNRAFKKETGITPSEYYQKYH